MKVRIDIDTKTFIRFWLVVIGFLLAGLVIFRTRDALILVGISAFLAMALNKPVSWLAGFFPKSKKNRVPGTAAAYSLIVLLLVVFCWFVVPPIVEQTNNFVSNIPDIVESASRQYDGIKEFVNEHNLQPYLDQATDSIENYSADLAKNFGNLLFGSLSAIINGIFSIFVILMMTFLMLVEGPEWMRRLWSLYNDEDKMKTHKKIVGRMYNAVSGYVNGQLTVVSISGLCGALVVFILSLIFGIPANLAIPVGVMLAFIGLIPMFGATIAGVLASLIIALNVPVAGVIFGIYFIIYQQIENNIISPMIQAKTNNLSALLVIVALTAGIYGFGILGALIAIPVASCVRILIEEYAVNAKKERKVNKKPIKKLFKKIEES